MAHEVHITPQAIRDITKLPKKIQPAILEAIHGSIAHNPRRFGKELRFELAGLFSARRGDYRIVYQIPSKGRVVILRVAHRRDAYRRK